MECAVCNPRTRILAGTATAVRAGTRSWSRQNRSSDDERGNAGTLAMNIQNLGLAQKNVHKKRVLNEEECRTSPQLRERKISHKAMLGETAT